MNRPRLPLPPYALAVPLLAGLGSLAFFVWKPGVARSLLTSPRAIGFAVLIGAAVLVAGWLLPRRGARPWLTVAVQAVPVALAFVVAVLPAFRTVTVVDEPPVAAAGERAVAPPVERSGQLTGIDHLASGSVRLLESDAGLVLRFEGLDVEPGPDYQVHLVPGAGREEPDGGEHLGALRGTRGDLNYAVAGVPDSGPLTALIWCRAFAVPVAAATLD